MRKPKEKYKVYLVGKGVGCYAEDYCNDFLGETWAVSEKQAISQVRYRKGGGPSTWILGDCLDEGAVYFSFKAIKEEQQ